MKKSGQPVLRVPEQSMLQFLPLHVVGVGAAVVVAVIVTNANAC